MIVEVSARKVTVPATCVCCHGHADGDFSASFTRTSGKRVIREQTRSWAFPCCHRCLAHVRLWNSAGTIALIVVVVAMDFMSQLQAHMMSHQYPGLLKKANLMGYGRGGGAPPGH